MRSSSLLIRIAQCLLAQDSDSLLSPVGDVVLVNIAYLRSRFAADRPIHADLDEIVKGFDGTRLGPGSHELGDIR